MLKKNKYIDYLHLSAQKNNDNRRITYENASGTISKLKRQNEDLRELLIKKDIEDQKRTRAIKTMLLYRQLDNKLQPMRKSFRQTARLLNSQASLDISNTFPKRLGSLSDSNTLSKHYYRAARNHFFDQENPKDHLKFSNINNADVEELLGMINIMKQQHTQDRNIILEQNSDISRLKTELTETKAQLKLENFNSNSSHVLQEKGGFGDMKKFVENKLIHTKSIEFEIPRNNYRDSEMNILSIEHKRTILEPVQELSEDETFAISGEQSETNLYKSFLIQRTKTPIEYVIDSEVSSDGEDVYIVNNLANFQKKSASTMSQDKN
ncbi:hypothetical protein PV327_007475 [Microctonus hyperodae]|uniref:Uncharacterized protein n=1 Tax=Microctonus hyperodae TaxID=165561 RepID=A0AA39FZ92_MICHY|nr:hypothetical protein PV327_007475 [Microctonus hyperodae]